MKKKRKAGDGNILGSDDIKEIENETSATSFSQSGDESDDPPLSPIAGYNFTSDDENETSTNNRFSNILKRRRLNQEGDDGDIKVSDEGPPSTIVPPFQGFKTASGKEVKVSDAALKKAWAFDREESLSKLTITPIKKFIPPLKRPSFPTPTTTVTSLSGGSRKFKPPTRIAPVPSSKIFSSMVRAPATVQSPPTPPLSIIGNVEAGMTQEVLDCISALIADGDEF
jgi:hypothetical protein